MRVDVGRVVLRGDTRSFFALGLSQRALRLETELAPNLSLLARAGLERLGAPGDCGTLGLQKRGH